LGFEVVDVTAPQTAMRYFRCFYTGVYVYDKSHAVMQYGDLILSVNGIKIEAKADLLAIVSEMEVGSKMEFVIYRPDIKEKLTLTVTVAEQSPETN
jgi:S1-C subfamily serine protease